MLHRLRGRIRRLRGGPTLPCGAACALGLLLGALLPLSSLPAQQATGAVVSGEAIAALDGKPIAYSLVALTGAASGVALTDRDGRFEFLDVPAGDYRLRLERVGLESGPGVPVRVAGTGQVGLVVRDAPQRVVVPPADTAGGVCYPGSMLERSPTLSGLWREARKAARARRALDLSYRYQVQIIERLAQYRNYSLYPPHGTRHTLTSTPELARALVAGGGFAGYGVEMDSTRLVAVPEMLEVLDAGYLRTNCLRVLADRSGERRVRVEPLNTDMSVTQMIGNVVFDDAFVLRRIEFEYRRQGESIARGVVKYGDGGLPGGQLRFAESVRVEIFRGPPTQGDAFVLKAGADGAERGTVLVSYGHFVRASAGP